MYEFLKVPMAIVGIVRGILSKDERKRQNRAKFLGLYLGDVNPGCIIGKTYLLSPPSITLGIELSTLLSFISLPTVF